MTNGSKRCGRLRKVTMPTSIAFIGKTLPTNLNKNLGLEENVKLLPRNELCFRIFIAAFRFGCLFGKMISNNKLLFYQRIFAVYHTITGNCFIGETACQNVLDDRWSNHL